MGSCILWCDSYLGYFLSLKDCWRNGGKMCRKWAGAITSDFIDRSSSLTDTTSDKHHHGRHTNEMIKCVCASECSNLNNFWLRENARALQSSIDPVSSVRFCIFFKIQMQFSRKEKASKTFLYSLKVSVLTVCMCVIQLSDSLHVSEG